MRQITFQLIVQLLHSLTILEISSDYRFNLQKLRVAIQVKMNVHLIVAWRRSGERLEVLNLKYQTMQNLEQIQMQLVQPTLS